MATQHRTYNFFEAQRRLQVRSRVLIGAFFTLLWAIANGFLVATHTRQSCAADGVCEARWYPNWWVMTITAAVVAAYLGLVPLVASRFMVAGPRFRPADGPDTAVFRNVVQEVAIAAGVPAPQPFVLDDPALNAFALSDGRRHGAVVATSGLLNALDRRELTGVVAHEIGHIRNRDSRVIMVAVFAVGAVVTVAALVTAIATGFAKAASGSRGKDSAGFVMALLALTVLAVALVFRVIAVPAALLMRAALSRRREQLADASAVQYTRDPGGLRRALEKLAVDAVPLRRTVALARPLYIDTGDNVTGRFFARWLDTHPPIESRIAWLRSLEGPSS
jgi:heat shock protein HtpX